MDTTDRIIKEARRIVRLCQSRDPFRIADDLGIHVLYENGFTKLKGMYQIIARNRFIILNANLCERDQRTVCAHEIGHDRFHRDWAKSGALQDFMFHDMSLRPEREANIFAAEVLIDDDAILQAAGYGYSIEMIAAELQADTNLVLIKLDGLARQGYKTRAPYKPRSDFLVETSV
ncbi:MAG: ImmA/IrrE family metallo-endopeptidase [Defluviitaleaceae bacterium]|nr:ImmA/IrrE family metallo-endopeptidase [Defluviitaleaceae bacterium]